MLRTHLYHAAHRTLAVGDESLIDTWSADAQTRIWLDVSGTLSETDAELLRDRFGLHPLALQDAARDRHPPKLETFEDHTFMLFKELNAEAEGIDGRTIQLAVFVGERFMITRHSGASRSIERLDEELQARPQLFLSGINALAVRLVRLMTERYLNILLRLEMRLEELETVLLEHPDDTTLTELVAIKSDLVRLRRVFHYHVNVLADLRGGLVPGFSPEDDHAINDLYEQQERIRSLADLYYGLASDLADGYISVASHRLNQIMRILTIITAIFVPLSFLAGLYGMNFEHIPELRFRGGYYLLLGVMFSIATTLLIIFRRKRWL